MHHNHRHSGDIHWQIMRKFVSLGATLSPSCKLKLKLPGSAFNLIASTLCRGPHSTVTAKLGSRLKDGKCSMLFFVATGSTIERHLQFARFSGFGRRSEHSSDGRKRAPMHAAQAIRSDSFSLPTELQHLLLSLAIVLPITSHHPPARSLPQTAAVVSQ